MSLGVHPFADNFVASRLEMPAERAAREKAASQQLILKVALSTLPLIGLAAGVVGAALWMAPW